MYPFINLFSWQIPSYGTMMVLGFLVAGIVGMRRTVCAELYWEDALIIAACGIFGAVSGASVLYGIVTFGITEMFRLVFSGEAFSSGWGLVFYGGLLGAIPGVLLGGRIAKAELQKFIAPLVPCIPLGHAFGRIGCFLAGCCYGCPTNLPIGVVYHNAITDVPPGIQLLPVQLFESAFLLIISLLLFVLSKRVSPIRLLGAYAILYAFCRFILEFFRYDSIRGGWLGLSTSQWISMALGIAGVVMILFSMQPARSSKIQE